MYTHTNPALWAINSISFHSTTSPLVFLIESALSDLSSLDSMVGFIWTHQAMLVFLATRWPTVSLRARIKIWAVQYLKNSCDWFSHALQVLKHDQAWRSKRASSAANFASRYRHITSTIRFHIYGSLILIFIRTSYRTIFPTPIYP